MPVDEILALTRETDAIQLELARKNAEFADFMQYLRIESANITEALDDDAVAIEFVTLEYRCAHRARHYSSCGSLQGISVRHRNPCFLCQNSQRNHSR